ncbi:uncharacterized protein LOC106170042 [Lingula anatina]|uniref:Uncharacterized protein LOC106170042 n=1 Tax=Lingula anatina TaxID=7574 RepID=A0A1S3J5V8_LINAN|nr:uncharacterized protein LOC106170042 [Lingula anatina]|eukprot:XP_013405224.1 uncharacterized protein LOC106170042 [Lingula anatina]
MGSAASTSTSAAITNSAAKTLARSSEVSVSESSIKRKEKIYNQIKALPEVQLMFKNIQKASEMLGDHGRHDSPEYRTEMFSFLKDKVYHALREFKNNKHRRVIAQHAADVKLPDALTNVYRSTLQKYGLTGLTEVTSMSSVEFDELSTLRLCSWTYSDSSFAFSDGLAEAGFLLLLKDDLVSAQEGKHNGLDPEFPVIQNAVEYSIGIIHNCAKSENVKPYLRKLGIIPILTPFLKTENQALKAQVVMTLGYLIDNDEENEILRSDETLFEFLIDLLDDAMKSESRRSNTFSAFELTTGLDALARNEYNSAKIAEKGALPLLTELLSSEDEEERKAAVRALWQLSFLPTNKEKIMELPICVERLHELRRHTNEAISAASESVLWQLRNRDHHKAGDGGEQAVGPTADKNKDNREQSAGSIKLNVQPNDLEALIWGETDAKEHIMISYNWAHQELLIKVRDYLTQSGFKVWMDINNMYGSTSDAMASAVENAAVVLISMSQRYKDSKNCRKEAEYADEIDKPIIPLLVEEAYKPTGWLGILVGKALYYDISRKRNFGHKMQELVEALVKQAAGARNENAAISPLTRSVSIYQPSRMPKGGSKLDSKLFSVDVWLRQNNLQRCRKLATLTVPDIVFLRHLKSTAPEFFFRLLSEKLGLESLTDLRLFCDALDEL